MLGYECLRFPCLPSREFSVGCAKGYRPVLVEAKDGLRRAGSTVSGVHVPRFVVARNDDQPPPADLDRRHTAL